MAPSDAEPQTSGSCLGGFEEEAGEQGRSRRYFDLTPAGLEMSKEMRRIPKSMWQGGTAKLEGVR